MVETASPRRTIRWRRKFAYSAVVIGLFFGTLEAALALLGVAPLHQRRDPLVGFDPGVPLFLRRGDQYETNPLKQGFFNRETFAVQKSAQTFRIFCLGGSTTFGNPYDRRTYFGSWLQAYLEEVAPQRNWEIINCGGISYASYRVALLTEELVHYQPDLFIIYTGHNEFLEDRTYGHIRQQPPAVRRLLRLASWSRCLGLLDRTARPPEPPPTPQLAAEVKTRLEVIGLDAYHRDDQWQRGVLAHFRDSLERIVHITRQANVPVILVQPAANLIDFTPFKSEQSPLSPQQLEAWKAAVAAGRNARAEGQTDLAAQQFASAARVDPRHAEGLWLLADALLAAGRHEEALCYYVQAKDEDVCPLRAVSEIYDTIRDIASAARWELVDLPQLLEKKHGLVPSLGLDCFLDHVHPTIEAHGDLGWSLYQRLGAMGVIGSMEGSDELHAKVARRVHSKLSPADNVLALHTLAMTLSWAGKKKEALRLAEAAAKGMPKHSEVVSQYGRLLEADGQDEKAREAFRQAVEADPENELALARLGDFHRRRGEFALAKQYLQRAVDVCPDWRPLAMRAEFRMHLGDCLQALGDARGAQASYRQAAALAPDYPGLNGRLKSAAR
jgi:tetratricopeptide (TPR) repeat protein